MDEIIINSFRIGYTNFTHRHLMNQEGEKCIQLACGVLETNIV